MHCGAVGALILRSMRPRGQHRSIVSSIVPIVPLRACVWRNTGCQSPPASAWGRLAPCLATDDAKALAEVVASGPPGILGFGFGDEEMVSLQRHFEPIEIRLVSGAAACRKGATLADAVRLFDDRSTEAGPVGISSESAEPLLLFAPFSRVVIFCGLPGDVIEGLIEVWPTELCESELISFAYFAESMAGADLEGILLKIIKASDAHDMDEIGEEGEEEMSKRQLRELLREMEHSKNGVKRGRQANGDARKRGFGR